MVTSLGQLICKSCAIVELFRCAYKAIGPRPQREEAAADKEGTVGLASARGDKGAFQGRGRGKDPRVRGSR